MDRPVVARGSLVLDSPLEARGNALGEAIFAIEGVTAIFALPAFMTVTVTPDADWTVVGPAVEAALKAQLA